MKCVSIIIMNYSCLDGRIADLVKANNDNNQSDHKQSQPTYVSKNIHYFLIINSLLSSIRSGAQKRNLRVNINQ
jgi:hypothetical protein